MSKSKRELSPAGQFLVDIMEAASRASTAGVPATKIAKYLGDLAEDVLDTSTQ